MVKRVLKRDGRHVEFNNQKIVAAILKAMDVTEAGEDIVLAAQIAHAISCLEKEEMTVEEIQDVVENQLMNSPRQEVAKEYIRYRNKSGEGVHPLPQQTEHGPQGQDERDFPDHHRRAGERHHPRECQHERRYPGRHDDEIRLRGHEELRGRSPALRPGPRGGRQQLYPHPRQGLLSHEVPDLHPAPAGQDPGVRPQGRPRRVPPGEAHRDGVRPRLHLHGDGAERDARRAATALSSTPSTRPWAVSTRPWRRSCTT